MPHLPTTTAFSRDFDRLIRDELTEQGCVTVADIAERHPWGSTTAVEEWTEVELARERLTMWFGVNEWFLKSATVSIGGVWFRVKMVRSTHRGGWTKVVYGVEVI